MIYFWASEASVKQIKKESNVSGKTCIEICALFREFVAEVMMKNGEPIGGLDDLNQPKIVEIDESKFGKRKYNKV
jgi:hypothetical protein